MAFDPKIVFGLCNVLNRHSKNINLKISKDNSSQHQIEQWAKRMDLVYRDSSANLHLILKEPRTIVDNLRSIENLSAELIANLYDVQPSIQKQISKGLPKGGFVRFRTLVREQFEVLKNPIKEVLSLLDERVNSVLLPEPIAVIDAVIDVWKSSKKNRKIPKSLKTNSALKNFTVDSLKVFEISCNPEDTYKKWYQLNHN